MHWSDVDRFLYQLLLLWMPLIAVLTLVAVALWQWRARKARRTHPRCPRIARMIKEWRGKASTWRYMSTRPDRTETGRKTSDMLADVYDCCADELEDATRG